MTNNMKRFYTAIMVLVISISMFIIPALAAGDYSPEVTIPVTVKLSGTRPKVPEVFGIALTADDAGYPMPDGAANGVYMLSISVAEGELAASGNLVIEYNRLGVYTYTIRQLPSQNEDCYQDGKEYNVTVYVTNTENYDGFQTSVAIYERGQNGENVGEKRDVEFENRYANPVEVSLRAIKTMDRKTPGDKAFSFKLVDKNGRQMERIQNIGKAVTFSPLLFDKAGTYVYKISEVAGLSYRISYDKSIYTVTIDVMKDENGDYQAEVSCQKNGKDYTGTPRFENFTKTKNPTTGDMFRMGLWVTLLVVSFAALLILVVFWFQKRKK